MNKRALVHSQEFSMRTTSEWEKDIGFLRYSSIALL